MLLAQTTNETNLIYILLVGGGLAAIATFLNQTFSLYEKWRKLKLSEQEQMVGFKERMSKIKRESDTFDIMDDEQLEKGYKYAIRKQDKRITQLEETEKSLRSELIAVSNELYGMRMAEKQCQEERAADNAKCEETCRALQHQIDDLKLKALGK